MHWRAQVDAPHTAPSDWLISLKRGILLSWLRVIVCWEVGLPGMGPGLMPIFLLTEPHIGTPWDPRAPSQCQHAEQ